MKALRILFLTVLVMGALGATPAGANRPEGCVASNPATSQTPNPCKYTATVPGGIIGAGTWWVKILRPITCQVGQKPPCYLTFTITSGQGNKQPVGTIQPNDLVTATATYPQSIVEVGNPCAVPIPDQC